MGPKARELAVNLALGAVTVVVCLGGAEAICRRLEPPRVASTIGEFPGEWQSWDGKFYTVKSTAVGWPPWEDYNHDGVRDREHALEKPPGVGRLIALGDSTTFGFWLRPEEAYPQVLQDLLDAEGLRVEVFNLALPAWTTRQELIAYRRIGRKYRPDHVLLAVCLNDFLEMHGNLSRPPALVTALYRRSALARRLVRAQDREIKDEREMFANPEAPKVRRGFELVFADLRTLRKEVEADGASFAVLIFPFQFQVLPGAPPPVVQQRILNFCRAERIRCLDLLDPVKRAGAAAFEDHSHFSALGCRLIAEEVLRSGVIPGGDAVPAPPAPTFASGAGPEGPPPSERRVAELLAALRSPEERRRLGAARALGNLARTARPAAPALVAALGDSLPVETAAVWALGHIGADDEATIRVLTGELGRPDPAIRAGAAWALGRTGGKARIAVPALIPLLDDPAESVRWRAREALGRIGRDPTWLRPLVDILQKDGGRGRGEAAELLGKVGPAAAEAVLPLVHALADPREAVRERAAWALGQVGPEARAAVPALVHALRDPGIRWRVADALGGIGPAAEAAVPALVAALEDPSSNVRWRAAKALGRIGVEARAAAPALAARARETDLNVRLSSIAAVEQVGAEASVAIAVYVHALSDDDDRVRSQAANALGRIGPAAAATAPVLARLLGDPKAGVRAKAARALGRLGPLPAEAAQALSRALQDPDESVRAQARKAVQKVRADEQQLSHRGRP